MSGLLRALEQASVAALAALVILTGGGCQNMIQLAGHTPLRPVQMSPDSSVLEVFFVRFPYGQPEANGDLWNELDAQQVAPEVQQRLAMNGFRVGVVGGQVPVALAKLLELRGKPVPHGQGQEVRSCDWEAEPRVQRSHWQLRAGARKELLCSDVYEELPALVCEPRGVWGETFTRAQGVLGVETSSERDGRVRLRLVPEVQHGECRMRYTGSQGMLRIEPGRSRRTFDAMTIEATLSPGQMLVLGGMTSRPGSLGHRFFTLQRDGKTEQKLLVIRLAQTQHEPLFDPDQALPLDVLVEAEEPKPAAQGAKKEED